MEERDRTAALIQAFGADLTRRQRAVLQAMVDTGEELVYEPAAGKAYLDLDRVSVRTVTALLRACAISRDSFSGSVEYYRVNETGRALLGPSGKGGPGGQDTWV